MIAQIEAKQNKVKAARKARDEKEMAEQVLPIMLERDDVELVHAKHADPEFVGHVVLRRPNDGEMKKLNLTMWRDKKSLDDIEAKACSAPELARNCLVYPSHERYDALVLQYPAVGTECGEVAYKLAKAGIEAEVKG